MTETSQTPPRSSVLFALGRLTSEANQHGQQIAQIGTKQDALPDIIIARLEPQLLDIKVAQAGHGKRLTALEQRQWLWLGGGAVLLFFIKTPLLALLPSAKP